MRVLHQSGNYRIVEIEDCCIDLNSLKGDCYNPTVNHDLDPKLLKEQEKAFEKEVEEEGIYGYILEKWDTSIDKGWTHLDSCYGFVGSYELNKHAIVKDFLSTIIELNR